MPKHATQQKSELLRARTINEIDKLRQIISDADMKSLSTLRPEHSIGGLKSLIHQFAKAVRLESGIVAAPVALYGVGRPLTGTYFSWWPAKLDRRHIFMVNGNYSYVQRVTKNGHLAGTYWIHDWTYKQATGEIKPVEYALEGEFSQEDIERVVPLIPYLQVPEGRHLGLDLLEKLARRAKAEAKQKVYV